MDIDINQQHAFHDPSTGLDGFDLRPLLHRLSRASARFGHAWARPWDASKHQSIEGDTG
jgi:hypothetical protein